MIWRRGFVIHLVLAGLNVLLLLAIVNVWWGDDPAPEVARPRQAPEMVQAPALRDSQPQSAFQNVMAKNLFTADRTGPTGGKPGKTTATLEGGKLLGTIIVGDDKAAIVSQTSPRGGQTVQVVRLGETWGGWEIVEISTDGVVLQGRDGKKNLNFPD